MAKSSKEQTCWLQITSGRGPEECALFVGKLATAIGKAGKKAKIEVETLDATPARHKNCFLSVLLKITGEKAADFGGQWQGVHLWVCKSPLRPNHRRKNWYVGVNMLSVQEQTDVGIKAADVLFETLRASGPGGQHVNTTDSAVRATHSPSGLVVLAREERSQHMNKKLALARLAQKLADQQEEKQQAAEQDQWSHHNELERGNPVMIFHGPKFQLKGP